MVLLINLVLPLRNNDNMLEDSIPAVDDDYWERSDLERFEWKAQRVSPVSLEYILKSAATNG